MRFYLLRYYGKYQVTPETIQNNNHIEIKTSKGCSNNTTVTQRAMMVEELLTQRSTYEYEYEYQYE